MKNSSLSKFRSFIVEHPVTAFDIGAITASNRIYELENENALLMETLKLAHEHLEYCGYGDKWERECAKEQKLAQKIENILGQK